jgi:hypothetical protein
MVVALVSCRNGPRRGWLLIYRFLFYIVWFLWGYRTVHSVCPHDSSMIKHTGSCYGQCCLRPVDWVPVPVHPMIRALNTGMLKRKNKVFDPDGPQSGSRSSMYAHSGCKPQSGFGSKQETFFTKVFFTVKLKFKVT